MHSYIHSLAVAHPIRKVSHTNRWSPKALNLKCITVMISDKSEYNTLWAPNASDNKGNGGIAHTLVSGGGAAAGSI